uniref:Aminopeptidase n=1 Tax=Zooxanthella nutricula TaxID=1333877 RepID=A0A7S2QD15_9DINO
MAADKAQGRVLLPDAVLPYRYSIRLVPDLERFVFDGEVKVEVEVHEATSEVTMHAKELQFLSASFQSAEAGAEAAGAVEINQRCKDTTVTFVFPEVLPVGKGVVTVKYVGVLNNQMAGFYRSSYKDIHGNTKTMASTQFESLDARRCFPCWDEPGRKAVFGMTLVVDPALTAFSNMPESSMQFVKEGGKHLREICFMDSPKMSTYLVAIVIGEFDFVQSRTEHGVLVRVYTPPGRAEAGTFALNVATKSLDIYDDFFGVPYPLPKLDMVAIPEFAMGAMENWGLVTYREVDLLIDAKTASGQQKQRVCIVVTHELAHQWFGNLVTMAWWDDLWLNEGFASWCENYAANEIYPEYKLWDQFASDTLAAALRLDSLKTSHPIQVPIAHAEEVEEVFDAISYCKGASVIRMAHAVLGHEAFQRGLQAYMKQHQYSNTETFHLWGAWADSSKKPVKEMMSSWTEQMGFPLVEVKACTFSGATAKLTLEQSWFLASGESPPEAKLWSTPLFIRTSAQADKPPTMMSSATMDVEVPISSADASNEFVLVNEGVRTPMRVAYTADMRARLSRAIKAGKLGESDRSALVMDAYALAKAGKLAVDDLLRFLSSYCGEKEYTVWDAVSQVLVGLEKLLMGGAPVEMFARFRAFAEDFVWRSWEAADPGWEPRPTDRHTDSLLRGLLMKMVSRFAAGPSWLAEARRRFERYIADPEANAEELPDEYRVPVFQAVLSRGGAKEHAQLKSAFTKLTKNIDQKHVFLAIGTTPEEALKKETLRWAVSGEIKIQDFFYIMGSVSGSSRAGLDLMWSFFKSEFTHIHNMVKTASPSIMDAVISSSTAGYCSTALADEIEAFFEAHPLPTNKRKISQVLEEIRTNAKFLARAVETDLAKEQFWTDLGASLR